MLNQGKELLAMVKALPTRQPRILGAAYLLGDKIQDVLLQSSPELLSFLTKEAGLELRKGLLFEILGSSHQRPPETMQRLSSL
jgi:hypothetical protein